MGMLISSRYMSSQIESCLCDAHVKVLYVCLTAILHFVKHARFGALELLRQGSRRHPEGSVHNSKDFLGRLWKQREERLRGRITPDLACVGYIWPHLETGPCREQQGCLSSTTCFPAVACQVVQNVFKRVSPLT